VWGEWGRLEVRQLGISESLWQELLDWQAESYDAAHYTGPQRSEEEWDEAGKRLATRLAAETGRPVEYMP
jgi:hypothetical protein